MNRRVVAVVQARLGSTRLPGKSSMDIAGKPMLARVLERARAIPGVDEVLLATTEETQDRSLAAIASAEGVVSHFGSNRDVLDRVYQAARAAGAAVVVRITGDCPLLDPQVSGAVIRKVDEGCDYASNVHPPTFPDGLDTEAMTFEALACAWREARSPSDREHVTPFIWRHPSRFQLGNVTAETDRSALRWTVDDEADLEFVRGVYAALGSSLFGMDRILALGERGSSPSTRRTRNEALTRDETDREFRERAHRLIPGGSHTFSRGDDQFPVTAPGGFLRGKGARVWDVSGREYVDWAMGINNVLVGHAEDEIDEAAIRALRDGQALTRPTPVELDAAEALLQVFPTMEMVKFAKNGSDANSAAVRLARAITGRDLVAYDGTAPFLSIHDWFIGTTAMSAGVPEAVRNLSVSFRYNDLASVEELFANHRGRIAAVVLEVCREIRPAPGFLEGVRRLCDEHGSLLVFDEVVTGFRYALAGAHSLFDVVPDLMSVGKAMANGYSAAALLGKRRVMERGGIHHGDDRVFFLSTTNGPERSALAAVVATVAFYRHHDVIGSLHRTGQALMDGMTVSANRHGIGDFVQVQSDFACRPVLTFRDHAREPWLALRTLFLQETMARGVFMPWVCPSYRLGKAELDLTIEVVDAAYSICARAIERRSTDGLLLGPATKPVFRQRN